MSQLLHPPPPTQATAAAGPDDNPDTLRVLSRSPHPYHRQSHELLEPADRLIYTPSYTKLSTPTSDSGTEADDEHFLKGLPAPKGRLHKGLRGRNESLSGSSTPFLSPAVDDADRRTPLSLNNGGATARDKRDALDRARRRKELVRRSTEVLLLMCLGGLVLSNPQAKPFARSYHKSLLPTRRSSLFHHADI